MTDAMGAVATATEDVDRLQPINGVQDKTYPYGVYSATLGRGDSYGLDSSEGVRWGRVVVQTFREDGNLGPRQGRRGTRRAGGSPAGHRRL